MTFEYPIVALIVLLAVAQSVRLLTPFAWRVALARRLSGHVPDRVVVWFAGQGACDACGGRVKPPHQRTR